jgi:hypothetical protein
MHVPPRPNQSSIQSKESAGRNRRYGRNRPAVVAGIPAAVIDAYLPDTRTSLRQIADHRYGREVLRDAARGLAAALLRGRLSPHRWCAGTAGSSWASAWRPPRWGSLPILQPPAGRAEYRLHRRWGGSSRARRSSHLGAMIHRTNTSFRASRTAAAGLALAAGVSWPLTSWPRLLHRAGGVPLVPRISLAAEGISGVRHTRASLPGSGDPGPPAAGVALDCGLAAHSRRIQTRYVSRTVNVWQPSRGAHDG